MKLNLYKLCLSLESPAECIKEHLICLQCKRDNIQIALEEYLENYPEYKRKEILYIILKDYK